jgi:hypothetical protein
MSEPERRKIFQKNHVEIAAREVGELMTEHRPLAD